MGNVTQGSVDAVSSLQLAVYGCGSWGQNIISTVLECEKNWPVELDSIVHTGNPTNKQSIINQFNREPVPSENVDSGRFDAVFIATPDGTHADLVEMFLDHDCHVFVEKPLAVNPDRALSLLDKSRDTKGHLFVGHLMCYHPAIRYIESQLKSEPVKIHSTRLNSFELKDGKSILTTSLIHDLSLHDLFYRTVPEVSQVQRYKSNEDTTRLDVWLEYPPGKTAHTIGSCESPVKRREYILHSEERCFYFDGIEESVKQYELSGKKYLLKEGYSGEELPLTLEIKDFLSVVLGDTSTRINDNHLKRVYQTIHEILSA
ncbi:MAG: Gfo/Idh/MocA family protein [bacterium]